MPQETRDYVPLILVSMIIAKNPEFFGIDIEKYDPLKFQRVTIPSPTDLRVVSDLLDIDIGDLREYNPQLKRLVTPPDVPTYTLYLPPDVSTENLAQLYNLPKNKRLKWVNHRVRRGETLSKIARMYGSSISVIRDVNNIKNVRRLRIGQILIIPLSPIGRRKPVFSRRRYRTNKEGIYIVKRGDNLWRISRAFNVDVEYLKKINHLRGRRRVLLRPGMRLKIPKDSYNLTAKKSFKIKSYTKAVAYNIYRIKRGDTLWSISKRFKISLRKLCKINNITRRRKLKPGMVLKIPKRVYSNSSNPKYIKHVVRRRETLYGISKKYRVKVKELKRINNLRNNLIKPGMILLIPRKIRRK